MKTATKAIAALMALLLAASACARRPAQTDTTVSTAPHHPVTTSDTTYTDTTTTADITSTTTAAPEPTREQRQLPAPYIDIEFYADGTARDIMGHVDCTMPDSTRGRVVDAAVMFDGARYTVPHLYAEKADGAMLLTYTHLALESEVTQLMGGGFTVEAFLVNHNRLAAGATEQCMTNAGQSGGFGLSIKNGKLGFGVYTDSSYKTAALGGAYDTEQLTHVVGVYDPSAQRVSLYINGERVSAAPAAGVFRPAQQGCHAHIVLGGDIGVGGTELHATNTRIADFKLYPAALREGDIRTVYETAVAKLTGTDTAYALTYVPVDGLPKGSEGALYPNVLHSYAQVYEPSSGITVTPTVLQWANEDLAALAAGAARPATVIFDLAYQDGTLRALDRNGKDLGELADAIKALNGRIIPAFRVNDPTVAQHLTDFLARNRIGDGFFLSSDAALLYELWAAADPVRPILDRTALREISVGELYMEAAACGAKTVLLDASVLTQENAVALQAHTLTVFAALAQTDIPAIHDAIFCGAEGIVTEDSAAVLDYMDTFTDTTVSNPTLIIAHRGDHVNCPDNILRSFVAAAESGASIIECDLWMTADGHILLNHDAKTTGWSEELDCRSATRAALEALTCTGAKGQSGDRLTFLDEMMAYFATHHTDMVFYLEMKDQRHEAVARTLEIVKQYGMQDRTVLLSMNGSLDTHIFDTYRVGLFKNSSTIHTDSDIQRVLARTCIDLATWPTDFSTQWSNADPQLMRLLRHRGIAYSPWTSNTAAETDRHYAQGYASITSNTPHQSDKYVRFVKVDEAADGQITVRCVYYDGTWEDVTDRAEFVPLAGHVTYVGGRVSGSGAYTFRLKTNLPILTEYVYYMYAQSFTR